MESHAKSLRFFSAGAEERLFANGANDILGSHILFQDSQESRLIVVCSYTLTYGFELGLGFLGTILSVAVPTHLSFLSLCFSMVKNPFFTLFILGLRFPWRKKNMKLKK